MFFIVLSCRSDSIFRFTEFQFFSQYLGNCSASQKGQFYNRCVEEVKCVLQAVVAHLWGVGYDLQSWWGCCRGNDGLHMTDWPSQSQTTVDAIGGLAPIPPWRDQGPVLCPRICVGHTFYLTDVIFVACFLVCYLSSPALSSHLYNKIRVSISRNCVNINWVNTLKKRALRLGS